MTAFNLIPETALEQFKAELSEIRKLLDQNAVDRFKETWIESRKVPPLLGISNRTWQKYRDNRVLPFSQFGSKIYVRLSDIDTFLEKHIIHKHKP